MRRFVIALAVASLALTLAGCGGGGGSETATTPTDTTAQSGSDAAPVASPSAAGEGALMEDRSQASAEVFEVMPSGSDVPTEVASRIEQHQAMLIMFYDDSQKVSTDLRKQVNKVIDDNRGMIDLISYNLGKATKMRDGVAVIDDSALRGDPESQKAVLFAKLMGVDHQPYIVVVDNQGYKVFWSRGFIDTKLLERQVERATR